LADRRVLVSNRAELVGHGESELRGLVLDLAEAALAALSPAGGLARCVSVEDSRLYVAGRRYDLSGYRRIEVLGAGKASAPLALGIERLLGRWLSGGLVVVPSRPAEVPERVELIEADHPVPSSASIEAGEALLARAHALGEKDLAICVFTGGSSALACLPAPGISAEDKIVLHRLLLSSPMSIVEINTVRKHTSAIKGGRLARALHPATVLNLSVSDVVGDPLDCITDLTVKDTTTAADALSVLESYDLTDVVPPSVVAHLRSSPEARSPSLDGIDIESVLVTTGRDGSDAVLAEARARDLWGVRLGGRLEGEASTVGGLLGTLARESRLDAGPFERGSILVACGGECTVSLGTGGRELFGRGGPSQEAAVGAALAIEGVDGIVALFMDTDGSDGGTPVAGAMVDHSTADRAAASGIDLRRTILAHDTGAALQSLADAVVTGLTHTNANDLVIVAVR
jgi:glycerate-2-kinase